MLTVSTAVVCVLSAIILALLFYIKNLHDNRAGETEESKKTTLAETEAEKQFLKFLREELGEDFLNVLSSDKGLAILEEYLNKKREHIYGHPYLHAHEDEYLDYLQELYNELSSTRV